MVYENKLFILRKKNHSKLEVIFIDSIGNNHLGGLKNMTPLPSQGGQAQRGTTAPLRATEILAALVDTCWPPKTNREFTWTSENEPFKLGNTLKMPKKKSGWGIIPSLKLTFEAPENGRLRRRLFPFGSLPIFKGPTASLGRGGFLVVGFSIFDTKKVTCLGFCEIWQFELNKKKHNNKKKNCPWKKKPRDRWSSQSFHEKHWKAEKRRKEGENLNLW